MKRMMKLPTLVDRKPSAMSAEMLEYCPSSTAIFAYLYLQRLLRAIHVLLSKDDQADMRAIADKADRLITCMFCRGLTPVQPLPQMRSRRHQCLWLPLRYQGMGQIRNPLLLRGHSRSRRTSRVA